jgi:hypothetical protein
MHACRQAGIKMQVQMFPKVMQICATSVCVAHIGFKSRTSGLPRIAEQVQTSTNCCDWPLRTQDICLFDHAWSDVCNVLWLATQKARAPRRCCCWLLPALPCTVPAVSVVGCSSQLSTCIESSTRAVATALATLDASQGYPTAVPAGSSPSMLVEHYVVRVWGAELSVCELLDDVAALSPTQLV